VITLFDCHAIMRLLSGGAAAPEQDEPAKVVLEAEGQERNPLDRQLAFRWPERDCLP